MLLYPNKTARNIAGRYFGHPSWAHWLARNLMSQSRYYMVVGACTRLLYCMPGEKTANFGS